MNKLLKYAPLLTAVCWLICLIVCIFKPGTYRYAFMLATVVLIAMNLLEYWSRKNERQIKGPDDKP